MLKLAKIIFVTGFIALIISCRPEKQATMETSMVITGGLVYDGDSEEPRPLHLTIQGDRIAYAGEFLPQVHDSVPVIDAAGLIVAPGFIDPHTHALEDLSDPVLNHNLPFLMQGITTVVTGSDGRSPIPISTAFKIWDKKGIGTNALMLVGHGQVRLEVIGDEDRKPTANELELMKDLVKQAMAEGAFGLSTGLYYAPGFFAETEEVIELAKVVASFDGIYDTHQRDESSYNIGLLASVEEVIRIGREADLPVHISHIKALGPDVWDKSIEVISLIERARNEGVKITANQYPYIASGTSVTAAILPRWVQADGTEAMMKRLNDESQIKAIREEMQANIIRRGGASSLLLITPEHDDWKNKSLAHLAAEWQVNEVDAALKIIREGGSGLASFNMKETDLVNFMQQGWVVTGSDGSRNHPRKYGTFPRKIRKYVLEDSVISMGFAINHSTSVTADIFKIPERGRLKEGYFADIVIFNPQTIADKAWFNNPEDFPEGIEYVILNGEIVVEKGNYQGKLTGRILKKRKPSLAHDG